MIEKLYQPDFSFIFGKKFANTLINSQYHTLLRPIFEDIESSTSLRNLLDLKNKEGRKYFYYRNLSINDEKVELHYSNIDFALVPTIY